MLLRLGASLPSKPSYVGFSPDGDAAVLPPQPSVQAEVLHWLCLASGALGEPRLKRSGLARVAILEQEDLCHPRRSNGLRAPTCYGSLGHEAFKSLGEDWERKGGEGQTEN